VIATAGRDAREPHTTPISAPAPDAALVAWVRQESPGRCAVLGAGDGGNSIWLARHGWRVTTVDSSSPAFARIRDAVVRERLPMATITDELTHFLEQGHTFDLVVITNPEGDFEARRALVTLAASTVGLGGHLFVTSRNHSTRGVGDQLDPRSLVDNVAGLLVHQQDQRTRTHDDEMTGIEVMLWATRIERPHDDNQF